jgi:predicted RNA binding protein YcfA (HicA-like mRNA interferase family)
MRIFTRLELEHWLASKGFRQLKTASGHKIFVSPTGARVTVLGYGKKDIDKGILASTLRDLERAGIPRAVVRRELGGER